MRQIILNLLVMSCFAPAICSGMGSDHEPGDLPLRNEWPVGVYDAVNQPIRVHGFWTNSSDVFFYEGATADLNAMTKNLTDAGGTAIKIVLHAGDGVAQSPWSKKPVGTADWNVTITSGNAKPKTKLMVTIDVWLGGSVSLDKLDLPSNAEIVSGNEIEEFIKLHSKSP